MTNVEMEASLESGASVPTPLKKRSSAEDRAKFLEVFDILKSEILTESESFDHNEESRAWIDEMLEYTVPGGKLNRGLSVVDSLRLLRGTELSEDEYFKSAALGWCIEWLQGFFLVEDDIMDKSITRRGQPCWYRIPKVGLIAINDGIMLNSHIFLIIKKHFKGLPCYVPLIELFNEVTYQTASGQMLDLITSPEGRVDLSKYTIETYRRIVQYKTAYYSFYLPVACALLMAGEEDPQIFKTSKSILVHMGTYFQVQDDYLDCYGDPAFIGKVGTDIEDTKCSWLVVQALQRASEDQKRRIEENYGKADPACVAEIKKIYEELQLKVAFEQYEAESYTELTTAIQGIESTRLQAVLLSFLGKIYKRQK